MPFDKYARYVTDSRELAKHNNDLDPKLLKEVKVPEPSITPAVVVTVGVAGVIAGFLIKSVLEHK